MAAHNLNIFGMPGEYTVQSFELTNVTILNVDRSGMTHKEVVSAPSGMQFSYDSGTGVITFDSTNPFAGPVGGRPNVHNLEQIEILYKV